ncbi:YibE/F family protein [[Clostridium] leptum]|nr:YibE/F family protein [[Clostridium] leptum]
MNRLKIRPPSKASMIVLAGMAVVAVLVVLFQMQNPMDYEIYSSESIHYDKGTVTAVTAQSLEQEPAPSNRLLGTQTVEVKMKNGQYKDQTITIENVLSTTHNIQVKPGQSVIVKVDSPQNAQPYFTIYNYDRTIGIVAIVALFFLLLMAVGRRKGVKSMLGLAFTLFLVVGLLLPMIYQGYSPILSSLLVAVLVTLAAMLLLNGPSKKTLVAILSTGAGLVISAALYGVFTAILHLSGYQMEQVEDLLLVSQNTGLKIGQVLFVGVLISSLGAVMDMTMSIASSLYEMKQVSPGVTKGQLVKSGMAIGRDMIGTMCETLILAFVGTALTTMLVLVSYGIQFDQLLSSDYIAIELLHAVTGSMAVVLSVPATALLSGMFFAKSAGKS